ncbi:phosphatase PAP2 family protein [Sphingomonas sp. QA11]|uniref:acid phosphatase n=1 Tax=Sphingomonas sp. QA11 TaxID=2950605 RepID=UPI002349A169|nr:phosphatase PAP2 family protein [Sphingomonas sp. QA11]WCM25193.1 phosphatase PAP2 family protein [Sphingomonas sp. QA11]
MMSRVALFGAVGLAMLAGAAPAQKQYSGYLTPGEFDVTTIVEPAPRKGDPRYETDRKIFVATRALLKTPRGALATSDADYSPPALMRDFSCAVGVTLTPQTAPALLRVVGRAGIDTGAQTNLAKNFYKRARPFHIDKGEICQPKSELGDSFDYPSGHTTWGWTWAFILTDLVPDRATQILNRGRAYGDSRFVCGAHNESAVEAGMASASATLALVRTKAAFKTDLEAARAELAALRTNLASEHPQGCEAEQALIAERVMPTLPGGKR